MGKAARKERQRQRKARDKVLNPRSMIDPVPLEDCLDNHSYWITGYYWAHDMQLVEPFCVVKHFGGFAVSNLSVHTFEFYQAQMLLNGEGTMLIFSDRVAALDACTAIENEKILLDSFSSYMTETELVEYLNSKGGGREKQNT